MKKNNRILGGGARTSDLLQLNNKDKNQLLLENSFNKELKNAFSAGLEMYSPEIDKSLFKTFSNENETKLKNSNFDAANIIINSTKKLDSNDILDIGYNKVKSDTNKVINEIGDIPNKIKEFINDVKNYPLIIGGMIIIIMIIKK